MATISADPLVLQENGPSPVQGAGAHLPRHQNLAVLDGWRGISILCVLACHMLPLGPKKWQMNACAGPVGMSLFFTLSGFLITSTLWQRLDVRVFFIRRGCRIVPLAYLYMLGVLLYLGAGPGSCISHALFIVNYDLRYMTELTGHLWSLCVEAHFYIFIGVLIALAGRRGFAAIPLTCLGITALRVWNGQQLSLVTHYRVDEILAGACVALIHHGYMGQPVKAVLARTYQPVLMALLLVASHPAAGAMNYLRPYCGAALIASTLWAPANALSRGLSGAGLKYIAKISYALYVFHPLTTYGRLGSGDGGVWLKYLLKRPISFALSFGLAHASTFYYEQRWIAWGKKRTARGPIRSDARPVLESA